MYRWRWQLWQQTEWRFGLSWEVCLQKSGSRRDRTDRIRQSWVSDRTKRTAGNGNAISPRMSMISEAVWTARLMRRCETNVWKRIWSQMYRMIWRHHWLPSSDIWNWSKRRIKWCSEGLCRRDIDKSRKAWWDDQQPVFACKSEQWECRTSQRTFELNRLMEQIFADMDDRIKESGLKFVTQLTEEDTAIYSDNSYFYRICQNLVENALKYSAKGTRVFIKTYKRKRVQIRKWY
mgnify:CR=1 FL=1